MQIDFPRSCARCALVMGAALFALLPCLAAHAEIPPSEASPADTERVFVSGVQDSFEQVRAAIDKAKLESGRDYRVIVVGDAGGDRDASTKLLESLVERWQQESAEGRERNGRPAAFDPARDVTIVLDIKDRQIAMKAPWGLEVSSGLNPQTIREELINQVFVPGPKTDNTTKVWLILSARPSVG